ncbi:FAD/NAD(P)-binding protein [Pontibacter sp. KCTC 32443]|uniref:FAD/NAD(P)-binding protein n=1 Tax=Pontibacter TaxID=323449 RepID=UPI00164CE889|nr:MULTISPECIES: FAD/NAD(P)-binding protein [Pontibacter]MBC5773692.1 FAD/NAD(P)-binding protein [Pontibacter sp. KCTC 32443]
MAIAIIGGGLSGTLTAIHLLHNATCNTTINLIDQDRYRMNRGIAYSSQLTFQPLNVPASAMSLFPEHPLDFFYWLEAQQHRYEKHLKHPVSKDDFIPRFIFGDYLKARLQEAKMKAHPSINFVEVYDEAISVKRKANCFQVDFRDHESIKADKVVLALGNFPPAQLPIPDAAFYQSSKYVASPWAAKGLADLPVDASLLLIGSSLTMVDLVGSLKAQGHKGKIYVISRHGLLPQPFDVYTPSYHKLNLPIHSDLSVIALFRFFRKEIKKAEEQGYTWRSVLDAMRPDIPAIWQALPLTEKKRFLRHVRPYWETHRHRMPASSATLINGLQQQGQLEVIAATILNMVDEGEHACITLKKRKYTATSQIKVSRVINCTGPQSDFTKIQMPLVQQLLEEGLIKPDQLKLGLETAPDGTLIGEQGTPIDGLYTLGPPRKATLYESTALREIREQAKELANVILPSPLTQLSEA